MEPLVEDETERPAVGVVEGLMGKRLKVVTTDDREFNGTFTCLDHLGNVLLFDTYERYKSGDKYKERSLNVVIVPKQRLKSAKVLVEGDDKVLQILMADDLMAELGL